MPAPSSSTVVDAAPASAGGVSRFLRVMRVCLREVGWIARELALGAGRCAVALWSLARQTRLENKRDNEFRSVGEALRKGNLPTPMRELAAGCERNERAIAEHRDALASKSPALGWLARFAVKRRLSAARDAQDQALRKLGEAGGSLASPAQREAVSALNAAMSEERARRAGLAEPWRGMPASRKLAVAATIVFLVAAGILLGSRAWNAPGEGGTVGKVAAADVKPGQQGARPEPRPQRPGKTAVEKLQEPKPDPARAALDFAQQRKAVLPGQWVVYGANPVLARGEVDQWDDFKVGSPVVLKDGDQYRMWYRGCHLRFLEYTCGVGHAVSADGISWKKSPRPVLVPSDPQEVRLLHSLTVIKARDTYWMWYSVRSDPLSYRPYATVYLATSKDGLAWQAERPVLRAVTEAMPALNLTAFFDGTIFHLWYRDYPSEGVEAVMHVTSADGAQWQSAGYTFLDNIKIRAIKLSVLPLDRGGYRALYVPASRNDQPKVTVGALDMFLSADGNEWRPSDTPATLPGEAVLKSTERGSGLSVVESSEGLWAWLAAAAANGAEDIRLAFLKEGAR